MKSKTKENLIFVSLYSLLVFSALGAMAGTYAWFEYRSRASTEFHGTAVNRTGNLRVGLYSEQDLPDAAEHGLFKEGNNYWAEEGLSADTLNYFLSASGYASNTLFPLTSGTYEENGNFQLKKSPGFMNNGNTRTYASKNAYVYLPLIFSVNTDRVSSNFSVSLQEAKIESNSKLKEAMRIHFDVGGSNYVFAPAENNDGYDTVGGVLDLDGDGYIDYDETTMQEYVYGELSNVSYKDDANEGGTPVDQKDRNCYNGVHYQGTHSLSDDVIYHTTQYLGKNSVLASKDVCVIEDGIAHANLTIYAEGWASSLIDEVKGTEFNLDLTFAIS